MMSTTTSTSGNNQRNTYTGTNTNSHNNNNSSNNITMWIAPDKRDVILPLQSKAKDMEQRLAAAIVQQQQMSLTNSSSTSGKGGAGGSSKKTKNLNSVQAQQVVQQQQQQQAQQISKHINRYRIVLCEVYSDWILSDPHSAHVYDVMNQLWRSCFYGRIGPARTRIQKEQRKHDIAAATNTITTTNHNNSNSTATTAGNSNHNKKPAPLNTELHKQKESLHLFLQEGITLYEYFIDKLQYQLQLQDSCPDIVPCLYRLYIHLGDLYRYLGDGDDPKYTLSAQTSYTKAMQLGPAYGHAYNQLAVVYQTKDSMVNHRNNNSNAITTVYWYTRSLGASQEPFATASSNLLRLFETNRQWLHTEQQQQTKHILVRPSSLSSTENNNNNNNNQDGPVQKPTKKMMLSTNQGTNSTTSRLCLSNFVDIQYTFYVKAQSGTRMTNAEMVSPIQFKHQITNMISSLQELLYIQRSVMPCCANSLRFSHLSNTTRTIKLQRIQNQV
jgi:Est1 DNA/RNA binding domain